MTNNLSRREFLRRASALSVAGSAAPWALNLAAIGEAAALTAQPTDYKALVCVFLYGGNDHANTLVPYDADNYNNYKNLRTDFAYDSGALAPTLLKPTAALPGGRQFALAPELNKLLPHFDSGKLGVLLNVGTLFEPTDKNQFENKLVQLPPKLFSHNDQQSVWQSSAPEGSTSGWGGRTGDLFLAGNGNATFTCVSVSGNAVFLSGNTAVQYQVTPAGSVPLTGIQSPLFGSSACSAALNTIVTKSGYSNLFESEHVRVMQRSLAANDVLTAAVKDLSPLTTALPPGNPLAAQLNFVASMIAARDKGIGAKRQVFFVSAGGFDTHSALKDKHPGLLTMVADALDFFYLATEELKVQNQVTTFTASDFGRTLVSNGDGSDHGWGGMQFVLGGAVKGKAFYGDAPVFANNGPNDVGQGRLLPTRSVDQVSATLATWFGVDNSDLDLIAPNLKNFTLKNLGFV